MISNRHPERGSVLLPTVLLVLAITIMGVGFIRFASRESAGASAGRKHAALVSCAEAGRQRLLAQFHASGLAPTDLKALNDDLDSSGATKIRGGHLDGVILEQVVLSDARESPAVGKLGDITNVIPGAGVSASPPYRVTAYCDDNGRRLEVEFGVRFGL